MRERSRKNGLLSLLVMMILLFTGLSEATVTLNPRVKQNGTTPSNAATPEEFVYFGRFKHMTSVDSYNNTNYIMTHESTATPVLWRVMKTNHDATQTTAILLSHYLVDFKVYNTTSSNNTWASSTLQSWLNDRTTDGAFGKAFTNDEWNAMQTYPDGGGGKVTLPSGYQIPPNSGGYYGEAGKLWFGSTNSSHYARIAHLQGTEYMYDTLGRGFSYWTRSPSGDYSYADSAWAVGLLGGMYLNVVKFTNPIGVRPVSFLSLDSFIFKSASVFNASSSPAQAGSRLNPYLLYLSGTKKVDLKSKITATVSGKELTIKFSDMPMPEYPNVFHAYVNKPGNILRQFHVTNAGRGATTIEFKGDSIILTLDKTFIYGEPYTMPTIEYYGSNSTDGIGFINTGIIPTTLDGFAPITATFELDQKKYWITHYNEPMDSYQGFR